MDQGLSTQDVAKRALRYGKNILSEEHTFSATKLFLSQFPTVINGILAVAGGIALFLHNTFDAVFIFAILLINIFFGFFQEYRAEQAIQKLKNFIKPTCKVIRNNRQQEIPVADVVPGDIVILSEGDRLPADGELIVSTHVEIDESILTGESIPVIKQTKDQAFGGTFVSKGKGRLKITQIGSKTRFGQIAKELSSLSREQTPLQKQIGKLTTVFSLSALGISLLILPIGITEHRSFFPLLLIAISIGVAAIPESLPVVITIALALGTNRMAKKHAIVRKMAAIETLGSVEIILTDKTGTLTQNELRVKTVWMKNKTLLPQLITSCVLGNSAIISHTNGKIEIAGDKTDGALLLWANYQTDTQVVQEEHHILDEYTFDPKTKTVTVVAEKNGKTFAFVRGAPEEVIKKSTLSLHEKTEALHMFETFAEKGLRVIAFAHKHEQHKQYKTREHIENNLDFLGLICLHDPIRTEAKHALQQAKTAGIRVLMVTGDNPLTAKSVAREVGMVGKNATVITGEELRLFPDSRLKELIQEVSIFARTSPEDKLRLTIAAKAAGFVVGVTGDGVNDALALKKADVGVAMGRKGTDVAQEAADIVLTDDNFATLIEAIHEGRKIYQNIERAITYLLSGNLAELALIFFTIAWRMPVPLVPTQILWINLVTDGLPALALAGDPAERFLLHRKPRSATEQITSLKNILFILGSGTLLAFIFLLTFYKFFVSPHVSLMQAQTVTFTIIVLANMVLAFIVRGKAKLGSNKFLFITVLVTLLLQILISVIPTLQHIFHVEI